MISFFVSSLQSCIGILATLILTLFALKRQEAKLWSQLKGVFAEGMYGTCRAKMYNFRKNKVENTPAIEVQLETVGRGIFRLELFNLAFFFSFRLTETTLQTELALSTPQRRKKKRTFFSRQTKKGSASWVTFFLLFTD